MRRPIHEVEVEVVLQYGRIQNTSEPIRKLDDTVVGALDLQRFLLTSNMELSVNAGLPCEVDIKSNLHIDGEETIFLKEFGHSNHKRFTCRNMH